MTQRLDHIKYEPGVILKDDLSLDNLPELAQQSKAQPKFTVTVVDNDTLETVMVAECDAWTWEQSELSDTLEFPDVLMVRPPQYQDQE